MPAGLLTIRPLAVPLAVMFINNACGQRISRNQTLKVAVQFKLALTVTLPSAQSACPDQPANVEPLAAAAVRVTTVPLG